MLSATALLLPACPRLPGNADRHNGNKKTDTVQEREISCIVTFRKEVFPLHSVASAAFSIAAMVVHVLSVAFTGFMMWLAVPGSDLFSWHPTCMSVAFMLLLLQAIVVFSPESSLFPASTRADKVQLHWILHAFGLVSAAFGFFAVYLNKEVNGRSHFTSWHGTFGLAAVCGAVGAAFGGLAAKFSFLRNFVKSSRVKMAHATGGMLVFLLAMTAVALAAYTNWFRNRVGSGWAWRAAFFTPIVLGLCVARQVTQSYLPRILEQRESQLDAKARMVQEKVEAKLKKKEDKKRVAPAAGGGKSSSDQSVSDAEDKKET